MFMLISEVEQKDRKVNEKLRADNMTSIYNNSLSEFYNFLFNDLADPRTNNWFLIPSPMPGLTILAGYLYFTTTWGPRYMKHRKPYELKSTLIIYNFLQVILGTYIVYEAIDGLWLREDFSFRCQPVIYEPTEAAMREARGVYVYFLAKLTELLDTVFFVLRKKNNQITFLHMYHHTVMPMVSWGCVKYYPGGHSTFVGVINSFVHIIMYLYYMLSAFGPKLHKYLWWKKYITVLQMVQFLIVFLHNAQLLFNDCDYPKISVVFVLPNAWFFLYLFNDFYVKAYKSKNGKTVLESSDADKYDNGIAKSNKADCGSADCRNQEGDTGRLVQSVSSDNLQGSQGRRCDKTTASSEKKEE